MALKTVKDMYKYSKENNIRLLSDFSEPFWIDYHSESDYYDRIFYRLFGSFRYFLQDKDDDVSDVVSEFRTDVNCFLKQNNKRYSELYRVHVLADDAYDISGNYDVTETSTRTTTGDKTESIGDRADTIRDTLGATNKTNTETFGERTDSVNDTQGERTDSTNNKDGARTDTATDKQGARNDTTTENVGGKTDTVKNDIGAINKVDVNTVAGFNSDTFSDDKKLTSDTGAHTDNTTSTYGSQTNQTQLTKGEQNNESSVTVGEQTSENTTVKGEQNNNSTTVQGSQSNSYNEKLDERNNTRNVNTGKQTNNEVANNIETFEYTKKGNIGVQSTPEIMQKHIDFWSKYDFYGYVFKEISKELLLVSDEPSNFFDCY